MPSARPTLYGSRHRRAPPAGPFAPYTHLPGRLNIEDRLPATTIEELKRRGHDVEMWPALTRRACSVEAILLDSKTGFLRAGADWRQPAYAMVS